MAEQINYADALPINTLLQTVVSHENLEPDSRQESILLCIIAFIAIGAYQELKSVMEDNNWTIEDTNNGLWDPYHMSSTQIKKLYPSLKDSEKWGIYFRFRDKASVELNLRWGKVKGLSFVKRVKAYLKKELNQKMTAEEAGDLGSLISTMMPKPQTYYFDITNKFDWIGGDFGDHQSCFFKEYGGDQRSFFQNNNEYLAIRFYHKVESNPELTRRLALQYASPYNTDQEIYLGYARAWLLKSNFEDKAIPLFNSYGLQPQIAAHILATYLGAQVHEASLENNTFHINAKPQIIYDLTSPIDKIAPKQKVFGKFYRTYSMPTKAAVKDNRWGYERVAGDNWEIGNNLKEAIVDTMADITMI